MMNLFQPTSIIILITVSIFLVLYIFRSSDYWIDDELCSNRPVFCSSAYWISCRWWFLLTTSLNLLLALALTMLMPLYKRWWIKCLKSTVKQDFTCCRPYCSTIVMTNIRYWVQFRTWPKFVVRSITCISIYSF